MSRINDNGVWRDLTPEEEEARRKNMEKAAEQLHTPAPDPYQAQLDALKAENRELKQLVADLARS